MAARFIPPCFTKLCFTIPSFIIPSFIILGFSSANLYAMEECINNELDPNDPICTGKIKQCAGLTDERLRLACYDTLFLGFRPAGSGSLSSTAIPTARSSQNSATTVVSPKPASTPIKTAKQTESEDNFGKKDASDKKDGFGKKEPIPAKEDRESIEAKIVQVQRNNYGIDHFKLDNGHVWRETSDTGVRFKVGQKVRIQEAILNTFNLKIEGQNKIVKVRRIK